jgi:hypothetical protein
LARDFTGHVLLRLIVSLPSHRASLNCGFASKPDHVDHARVVVYQSHIGDSTAARGWPTVTWGFWVGGLCRPGASPCGGLDPEAETAPTSRIRHAKPHRPRSHDGPYRRTQVPALGGAEELLGFVRLLSFPQAPQAGQHFALGIQPRMGPLVRALQTGFKELFDLIGPATA